MNNPVRQALRSRRSIRAYTEEPVDPKVLDDILACGMSAPSARNLQPWHLCVVQDQALLSRMNFAIREQVESIQPDREYGPDESFFYHAPIAVFVCAQEGNIWSHGDCGMLTQNLQLAAASYGLGACVIGMAHLILQGNDGDYWLEAIHAPQGFRPMYAVVMGHPAEQPPERERDLSRVTHV